MRSLYEAARECQQYESIDRCTSVLIWTVNVVGSKLTCFSMSLRELPDFNQTWSFSTDFHRRPPTLTLRLPD